MASTEVTDEPDLSILDDKKVMRRERSWELLAGFRGILLRVTRGPTRQPIPVRVGLELLVVARASPQNFDECIYGSGIEIPAVAGAPRSRDS
jgi:hypothetical protein